MSANTGFALSTENDLYVCIWRAYKESILRRKPYPQLFILISILQRYAYTCLTHYSRPAENFFQFDLQGASPYSQAKLWQFIAFLIKPAAICQAAFLLSLKTDL